MRADDLDQARGEVLVRGHIFGKNVYLDVTNATQIPCAVCEPLVLIPFLCRICRYINV